MKTEKHTDQIIPNLTAIGFGGERVLTRIDQNITEARTAEEMYIVPDPMETFIVKSDDLKSKTSRPTQDVPGKE